MPNALKGNEYLYNHPEMRAQDLMNAFKDKTVKAIICMLMVEFAENRQMHQYTVDHIKDTLFSDSSQIEIKSSGMKNTKIFMCRSLEKKLNDRNCQFYIT